MSFGFDDAVDSPVQVALAREAAQIQQQMNTEVEAACRVALLVGQGVRVTTWWTGAPAFGAPMRFHWQIDVTESVDAGSIEYREGDPDHADQ